MPDPGSGHGGQLGTSRQPIFKGGADQAHGGLSDPQYLVVRLQTTLILTTGTILLMWLGEQITDRGIGNGISSIITIGILARLPQMVLGLKDMFLTADKTTGEYRYYLSFRRDDDAARGGHCRDRGGDAVAAEDSRAIRAACGRAENIFGGEFLHAVAGQLRGVMPVIFASAILMFLTFIPKYLGTYFSGSQTSPFGCRAWEGF